MTTIIQISVDEDMVPLVDTYMQRREAEQEVLQDALQKNDFETLHRIGHQLKGSGPAYGFARYGELGIDLLQAAKESNIMACRQAVEQMQSYFAQIELVAA